MLAAALTHVMNAMVFPAALAGANGPGRVEEGALAAIPTAWTARATELHSPYGEPPAPDLDQRVRASGEW
ncbi:hypothetical protein AVME950_01255 [Acidovorax sp. SUPP950]|uniref:hypothetical protein n=1 Tax=unclassified Acidovorax TaxID=2684926 RepID=UPI0023CEBC5F|nr:MULTISPECIES: hypothetical protein [Comamonadaceae]WOI46910.1 hypothetical protein R1Z03_06770 [Paracidovorax avenae]GKS73469.1 hypothetical protein AVME950_01255 [Acidovorax sp. SUPP950]GKS84680.1 hypothetical protein AVMA1855_11030 [Acidovorax sp. SUPP1855]GKS91416.1 hypothetical protein AVTE2539_18645 [Acidovorax sp. SUPP2539]GKS96371.1 hypothetical protein AVAK2825_17570 [Acidovorax sp. SUPP2825]